MPANKYALLRYRIIDRCLTNDTRPYPNKEDLRQACEEVLYGSDGENISESTIEKDLWAMRNESELGYYAPITYSKGEKGYYYKDPEYTIKDISLNDEDLDAIHFAATTLFQFRDIPIFKQFEHAIEKIVDRLNITPDANDESIERHVEFESAPATGGAAHLGKILEHIQKKKKIEISYRKFDATTLKKYLLHPYLLKEYRNRWYLIAMEESSSSIRTFGLERIKKLTPKEESFLLDPDFNPDKFFKYSIGITQMSNNPNKVVFRCTKALAPYLESQPIHHSQKVLERGDSFVEFEIEVLITFELINLFLGFGSSAQVMQPAELRQHLKEELSKALNFYS
jgi:predicted DNA-binding transcriptional regulator YafY